MEDIGNNQSGLKKSLQFLLILLDDNIEVVFIQFIFKILFLALSLNDFVFYVLYDLVNFNDEVEYLLEEGTHSVGSKKIVDVRNAFLESF